MHTKCKLLHEGVFKRAVFIRMQCNTPNAVPYNFEWHIMEGQHPGGGGGVLPYMGYTGMCRSTGYVFWFSDSGTGYKITLSLWNRVYFISGLTLE